MSFAQPQILWALFLGLIPILIYYLLRFRALRVAWGANYVLERALERLQKTWNLEHLILLALRVLACLLIVFAFARPQGEAGTGSVGGGMIHHVIVLDGSYSMRATDGDRSRWEKAVSAAKKLVSGLGRGAPWSLCLLGEEPRWPVKGATIEDGRAARKAIAALEPVEASASLAAAFGELGNRISEGRAEVIVIADNQASTWSGMASAALPAQLEASVFWLNPMPGLRENVAVTAVEPAARRVAAGHALPVAVTVRSYAAKRLENVKLELLVDGTFDERTTLSLLPGQERTVRMSTRVDEPGAHHLAARLGSDALPFDNRHAAGLEVADGLRVTVLRNPGAKGKFASAWSFLKVLKRTQQLAAKGDGALAGRPFSWRLATAPAEELELGDSDAVVLDGGRKVTPALARVLKSYVGGGGGLLLAPGPQTARKRWNKHLGDRGLLAARLGPLATRPIDSEDHPSIAPQSITRSLLAGFVDDGSLQAARFYSWFPPKKPADGARVLARFGDRTPWALERGGPRGRVVQLTTGLNGRGGNLVVRGFFAPLVYRLAQQAAAGRVYPRTLQRGEAIRMRIDQAEGVEAVTFGAAGEQPEPVEPEKADGGLVARVERELPSGRYRMLVLREHQNDRAYFGVQGERVDSNLAPLDDARKKKLKEALGMREAGAWSELEKLRDRGRAGREWQHWLLVAALLALLGEMGFQRRFAPIPRGRRGAA